MSEAPSIEAYAAAAEAALTAFPVEVGAMKFVHLSENVTFRIWDRGGTRSYTIRLHRPDYHTLSALRSERAWTRALISAGLPAPAPLTTRTGRDFVPIAIGGEVRQAGMSEWVEGEMLSVLLSAEPDAAARAQMFFGVGELLARLHDQSSAWTPPPDFDRHRLDADGFMGPSPFWGPFWASPRLTPAEAHLLMETRDRIHGALLRYGQPKRTFGVIHADLHERNLVVGDGGLAAIDFDDTAFGWHQYDLAVALIGHQTEPHFQAYLDSLIRGYRSIRALEDYDLALLPMFLLIRRLAQIGWLEARPELGADAALARNIRLACDAAQAFEVPC